MNRSPKTDQRHKQPLYRCMLGEQLIAKAIICTPAHSSQDRRRQLLLLLDSQSAWPVLPTDWIPGGLHRRHDPIINKYLDVWIGLLGARDAEPLLSHRRRASSLFSGKQFQPSTSRTAQHQQDPAPPCRRDEDVTKVLLMGTPSASPTPSEPTRFSLEMFARLLLHDRCCWGHCVVGGQCLGCAG